VGRFDYYKKLSASDRRVYDKSDAISEVPLPRIAEHRQRAELLARALESEDRAAVERASQGLATGITKALGTRAVKVSVLARRPRNRAGELHGLYTLEEDGRAHIEVWMRTAEHRRVVASRTFLRILAHEICHHLDLTHFRLSETFHTQGFFRRESSLVKQLTAGAPRRAEPAPIEKRKRTPSASRTDQPRRRRESRQLSLFG